MAQETDMDELEEQNSNNEDSGKRSCMQRLKSATCAIYINYFLSAWGDRMWHFSVGLFLVHFDHGLLLLAAIFGFTQGGAVLLLGGPIGHWVDCNGRLKVVRLTLVMQNLSVAMSALCVALCIHFENQSEDVLGGDLRKLLHASVILLAIMGQLASVGYKIAIEKDWIVVVSGGSQGRLANLNAVTRSIDLMSKVLAPTCVGLVMTYKSLLIAALSIAGWNVSSVFVEYALLSRVYRLVPRLAYKEGVNMPTNKIYKGTPEENQDMVTNGQLSINGGKEHKETPDDINDQSHDLLKKSGTSKKNKKLHKHMSVDEMKKGCLHLMFNPFLTLYRGWSTYSRQRVVFAGLALSCLYMTVLGFDSITVGYMYSQGLEESILGVSTALAGVTGIVGTFFYTRIRKKIGLERTGLIAFVLQISCLTLAVISIWAPGSPFDLNYKSKPQINCTLLATIENQTILNSTQSPLMVVPPSGNLTNQNDTEINVPYKRITRDLSRFTFQVDPGFTHLDTFYHEQGSIHTHSKFNSMGSSRAKRDTAADRETPSDKSENDQDLSQAKMGCQERRTIQASLILFLVSIITSRVGLWMVDLTVTQTLQESVHETERGVVNGVQNSLNMLMDVIKFTMVLVAPRVETYGILIILSFGFICLGGVSFSYHAFREKRCCCQSQEPIEIEMEEVKKVIAMPEPTV